MNWRYLLPPLVAWTVAQITKVLTQSFRQRRLNLRVLADMGGFPSSHTAMVMALTATIGRLSGLGSATFAIALIFSLVVMYDAAGVRRAAGRQAAVLNRLVDDLVHMRAIQEEKLRELIGHTPVEVLAGAVLGIAIGLVPL